MRHADVVEAYNAIGCDPLEATLFSLEVSAEAWSWLVDGQVGAIAGVAPVQEGNEGMIWMLTTDLVERYPLLFERASRAVLAGMQERWNVLWNYVGLINPRALRWAEAHGFSIGEPCPYGVAQSLCRRIEWRRS